MIRGLFQYNRRGTPVQLIGKSLKSTEYLPGFCLSSSDRGAGLGSGARPWPVRFNMPPSDNFPQIFLKGVSFVK